MTAPAIPNATSPVGIILVDPATGLPYKAVGGLAQIAQVVTSGSATVVTFNNIPQTFTTLKVMVAVRATGAVGVVGVNMMVNSDTTSTDYLSQELGGVGASAFAQAGSSSSTGASIFAVAGTSSTAHPITVAEVTIPGYATTAIEKGWVSTSLLGYQAPTVPQAVLFSGQWMSTSAITRLDFTIGSGSFFDGSQFTLYGM